jgi:hypothetical protein
MKPNGSRNGVRPRLDVEACLKFFETAASSLVTDSEWAAILLDRLSRRWQPENSQLARRGGVAITSMVGGCGSLRPCDAWTGALIFKND